MKRFIILFFLSALCSQKINAQHTCFNLSNSYNSGLNPFFITASKLNSDNRMDLVVANSSSNNISVFLNTGNGIFLSAVNYNVGNTPRSIAVGDLDGDLDLDLAVANQDSDNLSILLNSGNGTFTPDTLYQAGDNVFSVNFGDLDSDTDLDLIAANLMDNTVSVFLNNGNGIFTFSNNYTTNDHPQFVSIGDLDSDNDLDLAVSIQSINKVSILLNNGNGTFALAVDYSTGSNPFGIAMGDLDSDDDLDLAIANTVSGNVSVLLNNANGIFSSPVNYNIGAGSFSVAVKDLDTDGDLDIVATSQQDSIAVRLNNGNASFLSIMKYPVAALSAPQSLVLEDFDNDNDFDIAVANFNNNEVVLITNTKVNFRNDTAYCKGTLFKDTLYVKNSNSIYSWSDGSSSPTLVVDSVGIFSVQVIDTTNGCIASDTIEIVENANPVVSAGSDSSICKDSTLLISATGAQTYLWDNGLGAGATQMVSPSDTTSYIVTGIDTNGCQSYDTVVINIINCSHAGFASLKKMQILPYPNPTNKKLYFSIPSQVEKLQLEILDILGKSVKTYDFFNSTDGINEKNIDVSTLKNGLYLCKFSYGNKQVTWKFMKK